MNERVTDVNVVKDIYDGKLYKAFLQSLDPETRHKYLTVTFNTDGGPLFESSTYSIWPLFLEVNELPFHIRTKDLIVAALWFGRNKPNMNVFLSFC